MKRKKTVKTPKDNFPPIDIYPQALHRLVEAFPAPPWLILALAAAAAIFPLGFRWPDMSPPPPLVRTAPLAPRLLPAAADAAALPTEGARL